MQVSGLNLTVFRTIYSSCAQCLGDPHSRMGANGLSGTMWKEKMVSWWAISLRQNFPNYTVWNGSFWVDQELKGAKIPVRWRTEI